MSEVIFNKNGVISMGSVDREEDLKPRPGINLNPPPPDGRCECCGRHISELKPYGGHGDPLVGDFTGAYLVKRFRSGGPYDEEAEMAIKEAERCYEGENFNDVLDYMIHKYGKERGKDLFYTAEAHGATHASWECRDCAVLDVNEYLEDTKQVHESSSVD